MSAPKASKKKPVATVQDALTPPAQTDAAGDAVIMPSETNERINNTPMPVAEQSNIQSNIIIPVLNEPLISETKASGSESSTVPSETKTSEPKPAKAKISKAKASEPKATEAKAESKVAESRTSESRATETKAEIKVAETRVSEPKASETGLSEPKPVLNTTKSNTTTPPVESVNTALDADTAVPEVEQAAAFRALKLSEPTMRAIIEAGFEAPTPIQEQSIPILLAGKDLIGQAQTGTGKTAAFALPLAELLDANQNHVQAIILLPTRELCIQVAQEAHNLTKYKRLRVVPVYGGQPIDRQFRALMAGPQIVVGTPGRVLDHLRRGTLKLNQVRMVVLDEADEMLNMGFLEDVEEILKEAPKERKTALFSATMPPRIAALARDYLNNPERVNIESKHRTVALVDQTYYEVAPNQKVEALARILDMESPGSTIIFCRTRREVDELGEALQLRGYEAETLHGEMNQAARDRVMNRFRASQADLLIATDVAARGLDIDQITHVINYDIPWDVESYIHRIGRTGRAGRSGSAITLISPRERRQLKLIERFINAPIRPARVPTAADIAVRRREQFKGKLRETLSGGNYDGYMVTVEDLMTEGQFDTAQIAAAALQMLWQAQKGASDYDVNEAEVEVERTESGMVRLFLQIGRQDGIRPGDIVGAIANEAGVSGQSIGTIDIMDRSTFVEVPEAEAAHVMEALARTKLRGKRIFVDVARPREEGMAGGPPRGNSGPGRDFDGRPNQNMRDNRDSRENQGGENRFGGQDRYARSNFRPHRPESRPDNRPDDNRRFRRPNQ